jgi:hypothetical protein
MSTRRQNALAALGVLGCLVMLTLMFGAIAVGAGMFTP